VQKAALELDVAPDEFEALEPRLRHGRPLLQIADSLINGSGLCRRLCQADADGRPDIARFRLGNEVSHQVNRYVPSNPGLSDDAFHVAYVVRVVTPGTFALPESVVEDMYRPSMMARTDSGQTIADPR
jgi:Bacterial Alpha-2-macroglobulin MG10 domain